jgi:hypothetical protein
VALDIYLFGDTTQRGPTLNSTEDVHIDHCIGNHDTQIFTFEFHYTPEWAADPTARLCCFQVSPWHIFNGQPRKQTRCAYFKQGFDPAGSPFTDTFPALWGIEQGWKFRLMFRMSSTLGWNLEDTFIQLPI